MSRALFRGAWCVCFLWLVAVQGASAQSGSGGAIRGVVRDEQGGVLPGVMVLVTSGPGAGVVKAESDAEGFYRLLDLPPGTYGIAAELQGFAKQTRSGIVVATGVNVSLDLDMKLSTLAEEVVVTAQKREERVLDVPVPVTALDAQRLVSEAHLGLREYFNTIPGFSMTTDAQGRQELAIRGVTTGRVSIPTVGMLIDDVPYGFSLDGFGSMPDIDPGDLARIEVVRGPQGTLYGTSSMGGLIKYVTVDPVFGGYSGRVEIGTSSVYNGDSLGYNFRGSANLGLTRTFAVRVGAFSREEPGYIDNLAANAKSVNTVAVRGGLVKALWTPVSSTSITLAALYQNTHGSGLPEVDMLPGLGDLEQSVVPGVGAYDRIVGAYSATVRTRVKGAELTSITGYNINQFSDSWDGAGVWGNISQANFGVQGTPTYDDIRYRKLAQEVRMTMPLGRRVDLMGGAYFTREKSLAWQHIAAAAPDGTLVGTLALQTGDSETKYAEESAFANVTYRVTDRFDVQIGGRQSHYNVMKGAWETNGPLYNGRFVGERLESSAGVFTYLAAPRFKVSSDLMLYGRLASGYRPGGPNGSHAAAFQPKFDSDTTQNYEVGIKGQFADRRIAIDASLFYIDWQDIQVQVNAPVGGYKTNGSAAKSEGFELSATTRPLTGLNIDGWVTYTNAVLTEPFPAGSPLIGNPGDRLPYSSRYSGSLSAQQHFPALRGTMGFVGGTVSYVGERISNFRGTPPPARQIFPAYTRVDLRAGLTHQTWGINLFVNNVADVRGLINTNHYIMYRNTYIQPRTVGVSITKSFY